MCERRRRFFQLKRCVALAAALCLALGLPAAIPKVAEIEQAMSDAPLARKSALYLELSNALDSVDTDRSLDAARKARDAATTPHDELMADARIATLQRRRGEFAAAFTTAHAALGRANELGDDVARADLLLAYARAQWGLGDFPAALAAHQQLITLGTQIGKPTLAGRGHLGLSVVYGELGDRVRAREEEEIALKIAQEHGDRELESDALNNLGNNYRQTGNLDRARECHERALAIRAEIGNRRGVGDSYVNLCEIARIAQDYPLALEHTSRALAIYEQLALPRYVANAHLQAANVLRDARRLDEAAARLELGRSIAEPLGNTALEVGYQREYAALATVRGDWRGAYEAERKRAAAADKLLSEKSRQLTAALNTRYEADRRQQEIALLHGERSRQIADLRTKEAELNASTSALERANAMRLALGLSLLSLATALGAIIMLQRVRLRAERRVLEETRVAKDAAEEADRIKTRFLGIASHDIRGPLGNITNLTALLRTQSASPAVQVEQLDLIGSEAQRVLCLVEDLITTAALEAGKLEVRPAPMNLEDTIRDVIESLRWQASAKRQVIGFSPAADIDGHIQADPARIHQVIANLLSNAIKFSPPGEVISIALARRPAQVEIAIRDRGPGIAANDISRLFKPFERLAAHPTAGESSHGLGLSIAQEIVRRHGGSIRVESSPGEGATFIMALPAPPAEGGSSSAA